MKYLQYDNKLEPNFLHLLKCKILPSVKLEFLDVNVMYGFQKRKFLTLPLKFVPK